MRDAECAQFHPRDIMVDCNNQAQGQYWGILAQGCGSEVCTKTTEAQHSPVRLELATLVSSLLYGTRATLVLNFLAFENKKYTADDRFHGNGPYDKS